MTCSRCTSAVISFAIPAEYQRVLPEDESEPSENPVVGTLCTSCLTLETVSETHLRPEQLERPDFSAVSTAFPRDVDAGVPLALALGLSDSLALNRSAIETLLEAVERAGTDPLLVIDRLLVDPTVDPAIDLERRRHQLEQLFG